MKTKKSKFKQRLEEMVKKHGDFSSEDLGPSNVNPHNLPGATEDQPTKQFAQPVPLPKGLDWKPVDTIPPPYYKTVHIWDGKEVHYNYHRLWSEKHGEMWGETNSNKIKFGYEITHWAPRSGEIVPEYQPMSIDDIKDDVKVLSIKDVDELIEKMNNCQQYIGEAGSPYGAGYNNGINKCITILQDQLKGT